MFGPVLMKYRNAKNVLIYMNSPTQSSRIAGFGKGMIYTALSMFQKDCFKGMNPLPSCYNGVVHDPNL